MNAIAGSARQVVTAIQRHLSAINHIEPAADASEFLLEEHQRAHLAARENLPEREGQLLVLEEEGEVWLGLYLDSRVRGKLAARDPYARLDARNLCPFLTAVEETSHFLYLLWSAGHGRPVTRFELELQGEVDKFASSALVLKGQGWRAHASAAPANVCRMLFDAASFDARLDPEEAARYLAAHRLAARYCRALETCYLPVRGPARIPSLLSELRRFYRRRGRAKVRHILQYESLTA